MKFLCDRCKTRYSIADERVRGKILKIRCKNCSAVITVREGMEEPAEWGAPEGKATGGNGSSLPASAIAPPKVKEAPPPPPAALQEEWYVSLDGKQEGPFALAEAQAWVSAQGSEDDLHCWSEGFDDWLPIEKVSHFRGLRAKPATRPRPPTRPPAPPEEPKPLFAATLAALEADGKRGEAAPLGARARVSSATPVSAKARTATPIGGVPVTAKAGTPVAGLPRISNGGTQPAPLGTPAPQGTPTRPITPLASPTPRTRPKFDTGGDDGGAKDDDQHERDIRDALANAPSPEPAAAPELEDGDNDFAIGEVSRVVRLADLAAQARSTPRKATPAPGPRNPTAAFPAVARGTGAVTSLNDNPAPPADGAMPATDPATDEPMPPFEPAPPPRRQRAFVLPALLGALALTIGAAVMILLSGGGDDGDDSAQGGATSDYENLGFQVDDPIHPRRPRDPVVLPGKGTGAGTARPRWTNPNGNQGSNQGSQGTGTSGPAVGTGKVENPLGPDGQPLRDLTPDEVFSMSSRMEIGTRRCYERALKDDPFLKVSKIKATITVNQPGVVTAVNLSTMANTPIGTCLVTAIKRWKFRPSKEGIVSEFSLVFEQR